MPEGHTIHRAAQDHHKKLSDKRCKFHHLRADSAKVQKFYRESVPSVEALGKHLVSFRVQRFCTSTWSFGKIRSGRLPLKEPIGAVRVRLVGDTHCIDINGPVCEVMGPVETKVLFNRIGPDILRSDAEPIGAFARTAKVSCPSGSY